MDAKYYGLLKLLIDAMEIGVEYQRLRALIDEAEADGMSSEEITTLIRNIRDEALANL